MHRIEFRPWSRLQCARTDILCAAAHSLAVAGTWCRSDREGER
jgi:hypothetical protein